MLVLLAASCDGGHDTPGTDAVSPETQATDAVPPDAGVEADALPDERPLDAANRPPEPAAACEQGSRDALVNGEGTEVDPPLRGLAPGARSGAAVAFGDHVFLAVFRDSRDGTPRIWASRITPAGRSLDPVGFPASDAYAPWGALGWVPPAVAFDGRAFLVVWSQGYRSGSNPGRWPDVLAARISPDGTVLPPGAFFVGSGAAEWGEASSISVASDGHTWLVTWVVDDRVRLRRLAPEGQPLDESALDLGPALAGHGLTVIPGERGYTLHWGAGCDSGRCQSPVQAAWVPDAGAPASIDPVASHSLPLGHDGDAYVVTRPGDSETPSTWVGFPEGDGLWREPGELLVPIGQYLGGAVTRGRTVLVGQTDFRRFAFARVGVGSPRAVEATGRVALPQDTSSCAVATGDGVDLLLPEDRFDNLSSLRITTQGEPERAVTDFLAAESAEEPAVAAGERGPLVAWLGITGTRSRLRSVRLDPDGVPAGPVELQGSAVAPAIAPSAGGWRLLRSGADGLETLQLDPDGAPTGPGVLLCQFASGILDADIACRGPLCLGVWSVTAYGTNDNDAPEEVGSYIYAAYVGPDGQAGEPILLASTRLDEDFAWRLALSENQDGFLATWQGYSGDIYGVRLPLQADGGPARRRGAVDAPIPYNKALECLAVPDVVRVVEAVRAVTA